jgi:hypothetical protein
MGDGKIWGGGVWTNDFPSNKLPTQQGRIDIRKLHSIETWGHKTK